MTIIAIDIGGTQLRAAAYHKDEVQPIAQKKVETKANEPDTFGRLVSLVKDIQPKGEEIAGIGVSAAGPLDPFTGVVMMTPNIKEWRDFPLTQKLTESLGAPAFLDNDANLACLAEWKFGAGRGHRHVLYLTVSTGVGGGVIVNNQLLQGQRGIAAELGHTILDPNGPLCGCGKHGHLESYSSGTGIARFVADQLKAGREAVFNSTEKPSAKAISEAAKNGDALSIEAFEIAGKYLGIGVANFLHAFDPSIIIFGGGVAQSGSLLFDPFHKSLKEQVIHERYLQDLTITTVELGDNAGLLGARALAEVKLNA